MNKKEHRCPDHSIIRVTTIMVTGKLFVCVKCEAIYRDEPVTCCDCDKDAKTFIEGTYSYPKPKEEK